MKKIFLVGLAILFSTQIANAQNNSNFEIYGNVRFAHIGSDTNADGLGGDNYTMRLRPGVHYNISENQRFSVRLAYLLSKELEPLKATIVADGSGRLAWGSVTFDEFYYRFIDEKNELRIGRFQKSLNTLTNAKRSHSRYQSNSNNVHWTDGIFYKRYLDYENNWYGEGIIEYHPQDHPTFQYDQSGLDFSQNDHNFTFYAGAESREVVNNVIQRGFGLMYIPGIYVKGNDLADYMAFTSRITLDFPQGEALRGGSIRVAGEFGQNLNTSFENGTSMVTSVGINNFADQHEIMIEFAKTDDEWFLPRNIYRAGADEMEIRYRFFFSEKWAFDARYRIRDFRADGRTTVYSTFIRATYAFN
ncbi:MAG: hypothetical protein JJ966_07840 [Balneolaceae bacterium]|nr:hypothetical protein [Balneolaceae bacterium]